MLFNSFTFVVFFLVVFLVYWSIKNHKYQNAFLLISSYVFYAWWDWRFLALIAGYSVLDFLLGKKIFQSSGRSRKYYLIASVAMSLILLGFFKYFNFFVVSLSQALQSVGISELSLGTLSIILPLGISFYIFKSMSYTIDIYRNVAKPTTSMIDYMTFLAFFPQLAAGPIERAASLLPQLGKAREFVYSRAVDGARQVIWGFFKKIVIADNLAIVVNKTFLSPEAYSGGELFLALFFFAFQIYADFSGYSDIAIGSAKLLGFDSKRNFEYPYFARGIADFWRRWHISLSTWLRDYVYYPLILRSKRKTKAVIYISTIVTFILVGFWHGAGWNYIVMGAIFGLYMVVESIAKDLFKKR